MFNNQEEIRTECIVLCGTYATNIFLKQIYLVFIVILLKFNFIIIALRNNMIGVEMRLFEITAKLTTPTFI